MRNAFALHWALPVVLLGSCLSELLSHNSSTGPAATDAPALLRFEEVRSILEDSKGNYWFGSWNEGVCRFDGESYTYFTVEDGLSHTINFTQENGVGRRDHRSGGKIAPRPRDVSDGSASLHRVFSIGEDRAGNIWFGTAEQGAWRYDGESLRNFTEEDGLTSKGIMAIYTDRRGDLWLGGNGVFKFNGESFDRIH